MILLKAKEVLKLKMLNKIIDSPSTRLYYRQSESELLDEVDNFPRPKN